jgi:hypothetical protein
LVIRVQLTFVIVSGILLSLLGAFFLLSAPIPSDAFDDFVKGPMGVFLLALGLLYFLRIRFRFLAVLSPEGVAQPTFLSFGWLRISWTNAVAVRIVTFRRRTFLGANWNFAAEFFSVTQKGWRWRLIRPMIFVQIGICDTSPDAIRAYIRKYRPDLIKPRHLPPP